MNLKVGRCVLTCLAARHLTPSPREERAGEGWGGGLLTGSKRLPFRHQRLTEPRRPVSGASSPRLRHHVARPSSGQFFLPQRARRGTEEDKVPLASLSISPPRCARGPAPW
jgi:hypothetical protein